MYNLLTSAVVRIFYSHECGLLLVVTILCMLWLALMAPERFGCDEYTTHYLPLVLVVGVF